MNLKIKYREGFRPFAPSVLEEDYHKYFKGSVTNPYMLMVKQVSDQIIKKISKEYEDLHYMKKLYSLRSSLQSVTHVDFSARIQSVNKKTNPRFWDLINEFKGITGVGVLINTSFNVRGEPIVNSPEDAYKCFMNTEMDYLVIGNCIYKKDEQVSLIKGSKFSKD